MLDDLAPGDAAVIGAGGSARAFVAALEARGADAGLRAAGDWPPRRRGRRPRRQRDAGARRAALRAARRARPWSTSPYRADGGETALVAAARAAGATVVDGLEVLVAPGRGVVRALDGRARAGRRHARAPYGSCRAVTAREPLVTAGESHGPALVAILTGLPAGPRARPRRDRRRPAPPPAGLRPQPAPAARDGRGRGARRPAPRPHARDAARARRPQPRPQELDVGDEPVAARGRAGRARGRSR